MVRAVVSGIVSNLPKKVDFLKVSHNEYEREIVPSICYYFQGFPVVPSYLASRVVYLSYPHSNLSYRFQPGTMKITIGSLHLSGTATTVL